MNKHLDSRDMGYHVLFVDTSKNRSGEADPDSDKQRKSFNKSNQQMRADWVSSAGMLRVVPEWLVAG